MQVIGVTGPSDSGKTTLVERLAARLADRGTVATVKHMTHAPDVDTEGKDTARHREAGAGTTYGITDEEGWFATGERLGLVDALERLAPAHEYALVEGYGFASLPRVALDGRPVEGDDRWGRIVASGDGVDDVDVAELVTTVDALAPFETLASLRARTAAADGRPVVGARATVDASAGSDGALARVSAALDRLDARDVAGVRTLRTHVQPGVFEGEPATALAVATVDRPDALGGAAAALVDALDGVGDAADVTVTTGDGS
ncbi:molybdopterin-guanine dinucleotide biosynthesis protein B [Salinilacihabitans rarus]|uniref:molybdopterin-guanine dinucleotide biosynthesis protein B n=1 Tax=Salinilacihabitans rarus TaxID=2961596 RepID=UPI0020C840AB|nr:molybdopterin-guanine dinucleotide biosynthesis protein B [Salinilacihabitans rarus]